MVFVGRRASALPFLQRSAVDEEAPLSPRIRASPFASTPRRGRDVEAQATPPTSPRRHRPSRLCSDPNAVSAHLAKLIRQHSNPELESGSRSRGLPTGMAKVVSMFGATSMSEWLVLAPKVVLSPLLHVLFAPLRATGALVGASSPASPPPTTPSPPPPTESHPELARAPVPAQGFARRIPQSGQHARIVSAKVSGGGNHTAALSVTCLCEADSLARVELYAQWLRRTGARWVAIPMANSPVYQPTADDLGHDLRVRLTVKDEDALYTMVMDVPPQHLAPNPAVIRKVENHMLSTKDVEFTFRITDVPGAQATVTLSRTHLVVARAGLAPVRLAWTSSSALHTAVSFVNTDLFSFHIVVGSDRIALQASSSAERDVFAICFRSHVVVANSGGL